MLIFHHEQKQEEEVQRILVFFSSVAVDLMRRNDMILSLHTTRPVGATNLVAAAVLLVGLALSSVERI